MNNNGAGAPVIRAKTAPVDWWETLPVACAGMNTALFYPSKNGGKPTEQQTKDAKAVCARCDFTGMCLDTALANSEEGIWGGTTEEERARIRLERSA